MAVEVMTGAIFSDFVSAAETVMVKPWLADRAAVLLSVTFTTTSWLPTCEDEGVQLIMPVNALMLMPEGAEVKVGAGGVDLMLDYAYQDFGVLKEIQMFTLALGF